MIVVGDRVLVKQDRPEERTEVGLYLPETVVAKEKVQGGIIVATGPGLALPNPEQENDDEPWRETAPRKPRHLPMQAEVGDYALFLKKHAVELRHEKQEYLIVPHAAILLLLRDEGPL
jgi:co-chaperonin GroES (HSP10)